MLSMNWVIEELLGSKPSYEINVRPLDASQKLIDRFIIKNNENLNIWKFTKRPLKKNLLRQTVYYELIQSNSALFTIK